jgi:hypothetical protein
MIAAAVAAISTGFAHFDNLLMLTFFAPFLWLFAATPPLVNIFAPERPWCSSRVTCMTSLLL